MDNRDYYQILGVPPTSTKQEIETAYRKKAKQFHPDIMKTTRDGEQMKRINMAYETLGNPGKRAEYDRKRRFREAETTNNYSGQATHSSHEDNRDFSTARPYRQGDSVSFSNEQSGTSTTDSPDNERAKKHEMLIRLVTRRKRIVSTLMIITMIFLVWLIINAQIDYFALFFLLSAILIIIWDYYLDYRLNNSTDMMKKTDRYP